MYHFNLVLSMSLNLSIDYCTLLHWQTFTCISLEYIRDYIYQYLFTSSDYKSSLLSFTALRNSTSSPIESFKSSWEPIRTKIKCYLLIFTITAKLPVCCVLNFIINKEQTYLNYVTSLQAYFQILFWIVLIYLSAAHERFLFMQSIALTSLINF